MCGLSAYLEEVLDALGVVAVALATDPLHLLDLARLSGRLDVLEVDLWVLAEVHDGAQEVEQPWSTHTHTHTHTETCGQTDTHTGTCGQTHTRQTWSATHTHTNSFH